MELSTHGLWKDLITPLRYRNTLPLMPAVIWAEQSRREHDLITVRPDFPGVMRKHYQTMPVLLNKAAQGSSPALFHTTKLFYSHQNQAALPILTVGMALTYVIPWTMLGHWLWQRLVDLGQKQCQQACLQSLRMIALGPELWPCLAGWYRNSFGVALPCSPAHPHLAAPTLSTPLLGFPQLQSSSCVPRCT